MQRNYSFIWESKNIESISSIRNFKISIFLVLVRVGGWSIF